MYVSLPLVPWSAFSWGLFLGPADVLADRQTDMLECSGGLQIAVM